MCLPSSAAAPADSKKTTVGLLVIRVIPSIGAWYVCASVIPRTATPNIYTESPVRGDRQRNTLYTYYIRKELS